MIGDNIYSNHGRNIFIAQQYCQSKYIVMSFRCSKLRTLSFTIWCARILLNTFLHSAIYTIPNITPLQKKLQYSPLSVCLSQDKIIQKLAVGF